jgi:hypothetical protein
VAPFDRPLRLLSAALALSCGLLAARPAQADLDVQLAGGASLDWMRTMPRSLSTLHTQDLSSRVLPSGTRLGTPGGGGLTMLGGYVDTSLTVDDRLTIPMLGVAGLVAAGPYDTLVTHADGSVARVHPWTAWRVDILLPGVGVRHKHRRLMLAASVRTGASFLRMGGRIASGASSVPAELVSASFLVQAELEACRRLDPMTRVCVFFAPKVYQFAIANGASAGVRMEWGR